MSISISNRSPTYTAPVESKPETYATPSAPAATETPDLSPLMDLMKDAFSADPSASSGYGDLTGEGSGGAKDIAQMAQDLIKTLEQLTELLAPELADGEGGGEGIGDENGGVGGPEGAGGSQGLEGAGEVPEGEVGDWIKEAQKVLAENGIPADKMNAADIAKIIEHESSGNPNAINLHDQNAKDGHPSKGLMQTIDSTFNAYKAPGHDNVYNPVDNIVAAVRYAVDKYGSVSNVPGLQAMNSGGGYVGY